jgi:parallel beta-helix repeat protein
MTKIKMRRAWVPPLVGLALALGLLVAVSSGLSSITRAGPSDGPPCEAQVNGVVYPTVQGAVDAASEGDTVKVRGTCYGVSERKGVTQTVYISKTLILRGGYPPNDWIRPDPEAYPTTLDAQGEGRVLYITGDISPTVEGFRITNGDAAGLGGATWGHDAGGGVYVVDANPTIEQNEVFSNTSEWFGGGVYVRESAATLDSNQVWGNTATYGAGIRLENCSARLEDNDVLTNTASWGGGLSLSGGVGTTLIGNTVAGNTAASYGGGIELYGVSTTLAGNVVLSNTASWGGGLYLYGSSGVFTGDTIAGNAGSWGGGLHIRADSSPMLVNTLVTDNQGDGFVVRGSDPQLKHATVGRNDGYGLGVTDDGFHDSTVMMANTILVSHTVGVMVTAGNTATLESTLWGGGGWANDTDWDGSGTIITGTVNIWDDPDFVDPDGGDYHIQTWSPAADAGVDAGISEDIDGEPRPIGPGFDIGVDEADVCRGADVNRDGRVDVIDIMLVVARWGCCDGDTCYEARCDVNSDGVIDLMDLMIVVSRWRWPCP